MALIRARGIIIKQSPYGEGHRLLNIFAEGYGIIKAVSYGAGKSKSATAASSQFLCYGTFDLYEGTKQLMSVNSINTEDGFYPISEDIEKLALAAYLSEITYGILGERNSDDRVLKLFLNAVYALAYRKENIRKIKAAYELKLMCAGGYEPMLQNCVGCSEENIIALSLEKGGMVCSKCMDKNTVRVNEHVINAMKYIVGCEDKKMLAFDANEELINYLSSICERYVSIQLDRSFKSLDYYKLITLS